MRTQSKQNNTKTKQKQNNKKQKINPLFFGKIEYN
jgi:hypothetical protein